MSYPMIEIGDLMLKRNGSVDPSKFPDETFELHSIPAFDKGTPDIVKGSEIGSSKQLVQENDVMISKIVPHIRRASVVCPKGDYRQVASGEWIVFRSDKIYPDYLKHVLISDTFNKQFMATVSGVGGSLLRARPAFVAKIKIALPPLTEQRRIASILDQADVLRQKRQQAIEKLDQLLQATFIDMFGDPASNPKGWEVFKSKTLFQDPPRIGTTTPANGEGIPVVRVGELGQFKINFNACGRVKITEADFKKYELQVGDLVLARAIGSKNQLGKCSYFSGHSEPVCIDSHVMRLRPNTEKMHPLWFYFLLSSDEGKKILQAKGGATAVQFNINSAQANDLDIALPPLGEQMKFVEIANKVLLDRESYIESLKGHNLLFSSLQNRAFSGIL